MDTLFDRKAADAAAEDAISRVKRGVDKEWLRQALVGVRCACDHLAEFTTDDVWRLVREVREPRAMGAVMRLAEDLGYCKATDQYRKSKRAACHGRPLRVWRSLLKVDIGGIEHGRSNAKTA